MILLLRGVEMGRIRLLMGHVEEHYYAGRFFAQDYYRSKKAITILITVIRLVRMGTINLKRLY